MRQYYVYIMSNRTHVLYIGVTNDIDRRVAQHQEGVNPGFAQRYHLKRLVYFESYDKIADAIAREKQLKGWRRARKIALIESLNPRWSDLASLRGGPSTRAALAQDDIKKTMRGHSY
jgi:putative endonuclease